MNAKQKVVVVGAGVIGAAHAFELSKNENCEVTVLEAASGPAINFGTGSSSGCVRRCYSSVDLARLADYGFDFLDILQKQNPQIPFFFKAGCISFGSADNSYQTIYKKIFGEAGFNVQEFNEDELKQKYPNLRIAPAETGILDDRAGYADPYQVTGLLVAAAKRNSACFIFNKAVARILSNAGKVTGVVTQDGDVIAADIVVVAAAFHARKLLAESGITPKIPSTSIRPVFTLFAPLAEGKFSGPVFADFTYNIYGKPEAGGILIGSLSPEDEEAKVKEVDPGFSVSQAQISGLLERAQSRLGDKLQIAKVKVVKGFYDVSDEDWVPIQDQVGPAGVYVSFATSGHGFKLSFALAKMLAVQIYPKTSGSVPVRHDLFSIHSKRFRGGGVLA